MTPLLVELAAAALIAVTVLARRRIGRLLVSAVQPVRAFPRAFRRRSIA